MAKNRVRAWCTREAKKVVHFHVKASSDGFGDFKADLMYNLDSEAMANAVQHAAIEAEKLLDQFEIDPADLSTINAYIDACNKALYGVMLAVKATLPK